MHGLVSILCLFCQLTESGGVHVCVVCVADVGCFDGLGKDVATFDDVADCRSYMLGATKKGGL
ncbi:MAG: hypothetical protein SPJ90_08525 [Prevotella sp.]|nr:hypothetical protein [Prevotellaceae bacterium]MDY5844449.1 hypothetical protein [Prevotella sp.]